MACRLSIENISSFKNEQRETFRVSVQEGLERSVRRVCEEVGARNGSEATRERQGIYARRAWSF